MKATLSVGSLHTATAYSDQARSVNHRALLHMHMQIRKSNKQKRARWPTSTHAKLKALVNARRLRQRAGGPQRVLQFQRWWGGGGPKEAAPGSGSDPSELFRRTTTKTGNPF